MLDWIDAHKPGTNYNHILWCDDFSFTFSLIPHNLAALEWLERNNKEVRYDKLLYWMDGQQKVQHHSLIWLLRQCRAKGWIVDKFNTCLENRIFRKAILQDIQELVEVCPQNVVIEYDFLLISVVQSGRDDLFDFFLPHFLTTDADLRATLVVHDRFDKFVALMADQGWIMTFKEMCLSIKHALPWHSLKFFQWAAAHETPDYDLMVSSLLNHELQCRKDHRQRFDTVVDECLTWLTDQGYDFAGDARLRQVLEDLAAWIDDLPKLRNRYG
jgi:hypothetical protein